MESGIKRRMTSLEEANRQYFTISVHLNSGFIKGMGFGERALKEVAYCTLVRGP
jgi:hypothetical protein